MGSHHHKEQIQFEQTSPTVPAKDVRDTVYFSDKLLEWVLSCYHLNLNIAISVVYVRSRRQLSDSTLDHHPPHPHITQTVQSIGIRTDSIFLFPITSITKYFPRYVLHLLSPPTHPPTTDSQHELATARPSSKRAHFPLLDAYGTRVRCHVSRVGEAGCD